MNKHEGQQGDLFGKASYPATPGYVKGSDTSKYAAEHLNLNARTAMHRTICDLIARSAAGMTCDEVEAELNLRHQTASARIRELALADRIYDTGRRRSTRSGSPARVYRFKVKAVA